MTSLARPVCHLERRKTGGKSRLFWCVSCFLAFPVFSQLLSKWSGGIPASLACTDPVGTQLSTVTTKTGHLGWLKEITSFLWCGKNQKVPMEIVRGRTYKLQGSRMVVRRPSRKTALVCFWDFGRSGTAGGEWVGNWWWRVSRRSWKAATWRNPPVGFDQPDCPSDLTNLDGGQQPDLTNSHSRWSTPKTLPS